MFILFPPTFVDLSGEFVNILLGRLALGNNFFVPKVVQKTLNLLDVNIRWQFHDDGICRASASRSAAPIVGANFCFAKLHDK